jgi:hypothetical protein
MWRGSPQKLTKGTKRMRWSPSFPSLPSVVIGEHYFDFHPCRISVQRQCDPRLQFGESALLRSGTLWFGEHGGES